MYLPLEIPQAQVLISVKTYPLPSNKYDELVCTAGFLPDGKWIRIYPIPFRALPYDKQYQKYHWITVDLIKNGKDFRQESYRPQPGKGEIEIGERVGTEHEWVERKKYALNEVFTSMNDLLRLSREGGRKSLGTLKPREIIDFVIEPGEREWKPQWLAQFRQYSLFDVDERGEGKERKVVRKLPYKYSYKFFSDGDKNPRKLMIEDWEIGTLFWKCLERTGGDENAANRLVKKKYFDEFCARNDLYFFLGTTLQYHAIKSSNPFLIIGVFYPLKMKDVPSKKPARSTLKTDGVVQQPLDFFD